MWLGLITLILGFLILWWLKKTSKPLNFPNGPPRYPIIGSMLNPAFKNPWSSKPSVFWGIRNLQKEYGDTIGLYVGDFPAVVLCDYEDIKTVFNTDEASARPPQAPSHRTREGWHYILDTDPVLNKGRTPGVILSNVRFFDFLTARMYRYLPRSEVI